jgi:hypothetical protein
MLTQTTAIVKGIRRDSPALDPVDALASPFPQPVSPSTDYLIFIEFVDPFSGEPTQGYFCATESYGVNHPIGSSIPIACENRLADFMGVWRVTDSFLSSHKGDIVQDLRIK